MKNEKDKTIKEISIRVAEDLERLMEQSFVNVPDADFYTKLDTWATNNPPNNGFENTTFDPAMLDRSSAEFLGWT